jgi:hypothetical protein
VPKRHREALAIINPGACNPSGIALSIHEACKEASREGLGTAAVCADPAIRLMVHQLAYICGIHDGSFSEHYTAAEKECARLMTPDKYEIEVDGFDQRIPLPANTDEEIGNVLRRLGAPDASFSIYRNGDEIGCGGPQK